MLGKRTLGKRTQAAFAAGDFFSFVNVTVTVIVTVYFGWGCFGFASHR